MKRLFVLFTVITLALAVCGCAGGTETGGSEPTAPDKAGYDTAVSYANWSDSDDLYYSALNTSTFSISSVHHLPIYKFDTLDGLDEFKSDFGDTLTMNLGYDEIPSFNDATAEYNEAFFKKNSLLLVYVGTSSCTYRFRVKDVIADSGCFCVNIEETTKAEAIDTAMCGWFITVTVPDKEIKNYTEFDATLTY